MAHLKKAHSFYAAKLLPRVTHGSNTNYFHVLLIFRNTLCIRS